MIKGALFDLDGVIADTADYHFAAWRALVRKHFQAELPDSLEEQTKGVSREDSLRVILNHLQISVSDEDFTRLTAEKNAAYVRALDQLTPAAILPGIAGFIEELKTRGIHIALASASKNGPLILEKLGLLHVFDAIVDPSQLAAGKPAPDIFLAAAAALRLEPADCIGIEDSVAGITAINSAGSFSVAVGGPELEQAALRFESTALLDYDSIAAAWSRWQG